MYRIVIYRFSVKIKLQIWGTWIFYAVLVDLGHAVADERSLPFDDISLEMIYCGLDHFTMAHQKGKAMYPYGFASHSWGKPPRPHWLTK
jgi:hypothetical protein